MKFSNRANRLLGQGMYTIQALTRGNPNLLHFEIGDSCFNSPKKVKEDCIKAIKNNKTHYTDPLGLPELRKAIADKHRIKIENVAVCPANFGIFAALSILCNKGDKINYPIPGFPTYKGVASYLGLKRDKKAKIRIINYPSNPTGETTCNVEAKFLIRDYAYEGMVYESSMSSTIYKNHLDIYSFSKTHAMSGYRLGYVIAQKEIIEKIGLLIETTYSCLPQFTQYAGIEALKVEGYKMKELRKRRDLMYNALKKHYELEKPKGGIYCWCKCKDGNKEFDKLLKKGIVACPGSVFGKKGFIRFCFAKPIKDINKLKEILN